MSEYDEMSLREIITGWQDGDGIGWPAEFAWLRTYHYRQLADLTVDVAQNGFKEPIYLGYDGRVWDGHHRLAVADALNWRHLPVLHAMPEPGDGVTPLATPPPPIPARKHPPTRGQTMHDNPGIYPTLPSRELGDDQAWMLESVRGTEWQTCWEFVLTHRLTEAEGAAFWTGANLAMTAATTATPADERKP